MQIDHIVTKNNAWHAGAWNWTDNQRKNFENDENDPELWAVSQPSNGSKAERSPGPPGSPGTYMPPNAGITCSYLEMWTAVKYVWALQMTTDEFTFIQNTMSTCS